MTEASRSEVVVELQDVSKRYKDGAVSALDKVSLSIRFGDFACIVGPSGSGKSTLLNMLGLLDLPDEGRVLFEGQPMDRSAQIDHLRLNRIGFVFQSFYLLPNLTALENVQVPLIGGTVRPREREERARHLLEKVGLENRLDHLPSQLSIGQRQRVAIARSLVNQPSLLLADEPTGNLDSASGAEILNLLRSFHRDLGMTLVIVTHDAAIAAQGSRVIRLSDGRIVGPTSS